MSFSVTHFDIYDDFMSLKIIVFDVAKVFSCDDVDDFQ